MPQGKWTKESQTPHSSRPPNAYYTLEIRIVKEQKKLIKYNEIMIFP